MKVQAFLVQLIAVLHLQCNAFAFASGPLLSKLPMLRKTLKEGL
jgi:hypothetical protein